MLRVMRVFRLFRINAYYDSFKLITDVLSSKKQQLFSSVFTILILMLASSLCMYSLEHEAQPDVFTNAFSGIWWAASTLLTVGYGDIYPITTLGKMFGIFITFLGVGCSFYQNPPDREGSLGKPEHCPAPSARTCYHCSRAAQSSGTRTERKSRPACG